jgi:hypothetical protein
MPFFQQCLHQVAQVQDHGLTRLPAHPRNLLQYCHPIQHNDNISVT